MSRLRERRNMALSLDTMPRQRKSLFVFSLLSGLVALQMLYLALDDMSMNLWLTAALAAGFVYSYFLEERHRVFTEYWVSIFAVFVSLIYYSKIQAEPEYLGNFLGIMAGILIVLLAFKAFASADHRFILLLETVVLIFSAVASFDLKYMLLLPLYLLAAGSTLYVASQSEILAKVSESSPDLGQLNAAAIGRSFYRVLVRAVVGLLILSVIAYTLTPHAARGDRGLIFSSAPPVDEVSGRQTQTAPLEQEERVDTSGATVGIGNDFDLTDGSRLSSREIPVLAVKSHRNGYLRAQVYDYFTGTGWLRSTDLSKLHDLKPNSRISAFTANASDVYGRSNSYVAPLFDFPSQVAKDRLARNDQQDVQIYTRNVFSIDDKLDLQYEKIRQEVRLLQAQPPYYFAMYQPAQLFNISLAAGSGDRLNTPQIDRASILRPDDNDDHPKNFSYTVVSLEPRYRSADLQQVAFAGPDSIVTGYTQLPLAETPPTDTSVVSAPIESDKWRPISRRLRNLAASIVLKTAKTDKPLTPYEKVSAIYDYLTSSGGFTYSREKQQIISSLEQTEAFCLVSKEGYCRQFASAMAVLCRINGVPSRIVTGFAPGSYSLVENAYIYKASDAHAWVEVYFDGYGWVMFDPSPTSRDVFNKSDLIRMVTGVTDFLSQLFVLDPAATQKMLLESIARLWQSILNYGPAAVLFISMSVLLILIGIVVNRLPRRSKAHPLAPENATVSAFIAVRSELARLGLEQQAGQTARVYLIETSAHVEPLHGALLDFVPVYEAAAFSGGRLDAEHEESVRGLVGRVQEFVREELKRRRRQRGRPSD